MLISTGLLAFHQVTGRFVDKPLETNPDVVYLITQSVVLVVAVPLRPL